MPDYIEKYIERLAHCGHGKLESYTYDENKSLLVLDFAFHGWYDREKIIDWIFARIKIKRKEYFYSDKKITLKGEQICQIKINWRNLEPNDSVPDIMKNLLSGVSYEQYRNF